jgi:type IV pilus assembly protein PilY1
MASPITAGYSNIVPADPSNQRLLVPNVIPSPPPLRCWSRNASSTAATGNSLTFARLDTGEVLGHFTGQNYSGAPSQTGNGNDFGNDHSNNNSTNIFSAPFIAPLSGVPVPYPGQTGEVSDRVYIGDADGLLWRIDMSDPDMTHWQSNIALAWDAYIDDPIHGSGDHDTNPREAMGVVPIIGRDPIGNTVILVATGDQDKFSVQQTSNHLWSLTELPGSPAPTVKVSPNWHLRLPDQTGGLGGARVTGPMELFNGVLYFATFLPQQVNVCSDGFGSVWAVDYLRRGATTQPNAVPALMAQPASPSPWPAPSFPTGMPGQFLYGQDAAPGSIIMGVSVAETPTCDSSVSASDGYFGGHSYASQVSSSSYHITWQTGAGAGIATSAAGAQNDLVKGVQFLQPASPGLGTRLDSWASIVE